jgi:LmbE family N-acetylglucosaminyl deacetylase
MKKILVVVAHPDDEILACGATIAGLAAAGHECYTLILGEGKTSRLETREKELVSDELHQLSQEIKEANELIGVKKVFTCHFPDNRFDSVDLLDIVKEIERVKLLVTPEIIFTHHLGDMNIDHQITHKAVLTATRPMVGECVKKIYACEVPSATEWNSYSHETVFIPNVFIDVSNSINLKIDAMKKYTSELREYPHPRSLEYIKKLAEVNGAKVGLAYSENFKLIRSVEEIVQ